MPPLQRPDRTPTHPETVSHSDVTQSPEEILAYWTEQKMAEATPPDLRRPAPDDPDPDAAHPGS